MGDIGHGEVFRITQLMKLRIQSKQLGNSLEGDGGE